jgi:hypothetical protein
LFGHSSSTGKSLWSWMKLFLSWTFGVFWVLPLFLLSKIVNSLWFQVIMICCFSVYIICIYTCVRHWLQMYAHASAHTHVLSKERTLCLKQARLIVSQTRVLTHSVHAYIYIHIHIAYVYVCVSVSGGEVAHEILYIKFY